MILIKIGGKAAGMYLAHQILKRNAAGNPLIDHLRMCRAWYITSDGLFDFVKYNSLEDTQSFKYSSLEEVREGYAYLEQIFKHSHFSPEMINGLKFALDELGDGPLIVRSSSLLEDSEGSAFSGKYRSLFLVNTGSKEERLNALLDAIPGLAILGVARAEYLGYRLAPHDGQITDDRELLDLVEENFALPDGAGDHHAGQSGQGSFMHRQGEILGLLDRGVAVDLAFPENHASPGNHKHQTDRYRQFHPDFHFQNSPSLDPIKCIRRSGILVFGG